MPDQVENHVLGLVPAGLELSLGQTAARVRVAVEAGRAAVGLTLGYPLGRLGMEALRSQLAEALSVQGTELASFECHLRVVAHAVQPPLAPLPRVRNVIAIGSGKGGVGKSTTAVNLALALAAEGARVGVLDADIYGPSVPMMLGLSGRPDSPDGKSIEPMRAHGIEAMSIGLLVELETPMIWRGPMATSALTQLLESTLWGGDVGLDYLIVDLPPGTGDIQLTLSQKIPVAGAVIVTTPQDIATLDARKALKMFEKVHVPVLGLIENMAQHVCSNCGHVEHLFGQGGGEQGDLGMPIVISAPDSAAAQAYRQTARRMAATLAARPRAAMPIASSLVGG